MTYLGLFQWKDGTRRSGQHKFKVDCKRERRMPEGYSGTSSQITILSLGANPKTYSFKELFTTYDWTCSFHTLRCSRPSFSVFAPSFCYFCHFETDLSVGGGALLRKNTLGKPLHWSLGSEDISSCSQMTRHPRVSLGFTLTLSNFIRNSLFNSTYFL